MRLTPGTRVGPYEVVVLLGRGMSEVYRATDTRLGRDVALKVVGEALGTHGPAVERFEREARLAASLSHPNVVALYDIGLHEGQPYFVTELLQGQTFRERLAEGPVPVPTALEWAVQAAQGLGAVHERGIVHRDLKPENLFVTRLGQVKLLDFGIAKIVEAAQQGAAPRGLNDETRAGSGANTTTGTVVGTPGYMPPEQVRGEPVDVRADVFSLGAVLYEMLAGRRAFEGHSLVDAGYAILHGEPEPLPVTIPTPVAAIVHRCLEKDPARRFQSVPELVRALREAGQGSVSVGGSEMSVVDGTAATTRSRSTVPLRRWLLPVWVLAALALVAGAFLLRRAWKADAFWQNPLAGARFQPLTGSEVAEHSAAISRDGNLVAFLSVRDGPTDVWFTRVGSGDVLNATRGRVREIFLNRDVRMMQFSPDGAFVTLWLGRSDRLKREQIDTWAIPTLPGEPRRFRAGIAELDWSPDGRRLVFHQSKPRDPTFVEGENGEARQIYVAPGADKHAHFPTWSPDGAFIYFVQGDLPNPNGPQDVWRMTPAGGSVERITFHGTRVTHPTLLDHSTLLYLATDPDGSGPWIHGLDVERRVAHRLSDGVARYISLAASADGRRLVATTAQSRTSLWQARLEGRPVTAADASRIKLPTPQGRWPRLGPGYLLYISSTDTTDRLWKLAGDSATELWTAPAARLVGTPAISPPGDRIAFSTQERGRRRLLVMNADGTGLRSLTEGLAVRGAPDWSPDGKSLVTAADESGSPHLFRIDVETAVATRLTDQYALDPTWAPDGEFVAYSGVDVGTTFPVRAVTAGGVPRSLPELVLNRGARRYRFLPGRLELVVSRGDIEHKDLWAKDLATGAERQLTAFGRDVLIEDFDFSPDGHSLVFERVQESSDIVLIDRSKR